MSDTNTQVKDFTGTVVVPAAPQIAGAQAAPQVKAPQAPAPALAPNTKPPLPALAPKTNVAQLARASQPAPAVKAAPPRPKGIISGNTRDLENGFFRFVLYSETNATKTTTAARFDTPEFVRIIGTRHPEQMTPLKRLGYQYAVATNAEQLDWLLQYPEAEWPDWGAMPDPERRRTLILDDGTEAVNMLLDDNEWIDGKEVKNQMRTYVQAGKDLRQTLLKKTLWKPYNFGMTALAKAKDSPRAPDEEIYGPHLPPAMLDLVMAEFEFVFYIDKAKLKIQTEDRKFAYTFEGPGGPKDVRTKHRTIYAKTKVDFLDIGKGVVAPLEDLDLGAIWRKIRMSQAAAKSGGAK